MGLIRVRRGNVILDIPSDDKEVYMQQGFSVIDIKTGEVLEEAMSKDVATLQAQVQELKLINTALKEENDSLKADIKKLKSKNKEPKAE